jgi:DNA polymerase V
MSGAWDEAIPGFLKSIGINNALQLRNASVSLIKKEMGISGFRILQELKGISCYPLEQYPPPKKEITVSRSFKHPIKDIADISEAIATYASSGAEKLRKTHLEAGVIVVFLMTNPYSSESRYFNMKTIQLPFPTSDTSKLIKHACIGLNEIYRKGYRYKKAGIILRDLASDSRVQMTLFDYKNKGQSKELMRVLDSINKRFGSDSARYAATGSAQNQGQGGRP